MPNILYDFYAYFAILLKFNTLNFTEPITDTSSLKFLTDFISRLEINTSKKINEQF